METLLTFKEAAVYLAISVSTLRNLVRAEKVTCRRLGPRVIRFAKKDLDAYANSCKISAT